MASKLGHQVSSSSVGSVAESDTAPMPSAAPKLLGKTQPDSVDRMKSMKSGKMALALIRDQKEGGKAHDVIVVRRPTTCLARCRVRTGIVMANFWTEVTMMMITLMYAALVLVDLLLPEKSREKAEHTIWVLDIVFLSILLLELCLKLFAFGRDYCRDGWNVFDGMVVIVSIVLGLMAEVLTSIVILRVLKVRAVLRVFRLVVVFRRAKQTAFTVKRIKKRVVRDSAIKTPLEEAIDIIQTLRHELVSTRQRADLQRVEELLTSDSLFRPVNLPDIVGLDGQIDTEMHSWLRTHWEPVTRRDGGAVALSPRSPALSQVTVGNTTISHPNRSFHVPEQALYPSKCGPIDGSTIIDERIRGTARKMSVTMSSLPRSPTARPIPYPEQSTETSCSSEDEQSEARSESSGVGTGLPPRRPCRRSQVAPMNQQDNLPGTVTSSPKPSLAGVRLENVLGSLNQWNFDVFQADTLTGGHSLYAVTVSLADAYDLIRANSVNQVKFQTLILKLEDAYISENTYHNSIHAADVTQTLAFILGKNFLLPHLTSHEKLGALVAAVIHDIGHPGVNNAFIVATSGELAVRYNDIAVLENMHCATFFEIMNRENLDIFSHFTRDDRATIRHLIIDMVLGTDMSKHFEEMARFSGKLASIVRSTDGSDDEVVSPKRLGAHIQDSSDSLLYLRLALHTADVSNPAKPRRIALHWTELVVEEFYQQGDQERAAGLPISSFMDRRKPNVPKLQLGFINFIVKPLFEQWALVIDEFKDTCVPHLEENKKYWVSKSEEKAHEAPASASVAPAKSSEGTTAATKPRMIPKVHSNSGAGLPLASTANSVATEGS